MGIEKRGFGSLSKKRRIEIASMGGKASRTGGFASKEFAAKMGRIGGSKSRKPKI